MILLSKMAQNYHRDTTIDNKIERILKTYKNSIKQSLSNLEIFKIFEKNKQILLFLIKEGIIIFDENIIKNIICKKYKDGTRLCHFFYTEIKSIVENEIIEIIKNELLKQNPNIFDKFEENRKIGQNDSYICSLIRNDSIIEFI